MVYNLTPQDVLHTRLLLSTFTLPSELIDIILDTAEYWALISCHRSEDLVVRANDRTTQDRANDFNGPLPLESVPVTAHAYSEVKYLSLEVPAYEGTRVRKVMFKLRSSDQGRSNNAICRGAGPFHHFPPSPKYRTHRPS